MAKAKFEFEWRVGDRFKHIDTDKKSMISGFGVLGDILGQIGEAGSGGSYCYSRNKIKPIGETKKRYKAEKLKWQQANIKAGDWVERIVAGDWDGDTAEKGYEFDVLTATKGYVSDVSGIWHDVTHLKPCKPPKPKQGYPTVGPFTIRNGFLYESENGRQTYHGKVAKFLSPNKLRQVADLLEKVEAKK